MNRRTGKIARFPKDLRDLVNNMLDDGAQYESIIRALDQHRHRWPDGVAEITINNLSTWHAGGYQDWVKQQEVAADLKERNEFLKIFLQSNSTSDLHHAVVHLGLAQAYDALMGFDRDAFQAKAADDPAAYTRLLSVLLRFSDKALALRKLNTVAQPTTTKLGGEFVPKALPEPAQEIEKSEHNSQSIISNSE